MFVGKKGGGEGGRLQEGREITIIMYFYIKIPFSPSQ